MPRPRLHLVLASTALAVAAAACGGSDATTLVLRAQSEATEFEVTYQVGDDAPITETVSSPWETSVDVSGVFSVDLTATNLGDEGLVGCQIEIAGSASPPPAATGEAAADCVISGSARSGSLSTSSSAFGTPFEDADDGTTTSDTAGSDDAGSAGAGTDEADEPVPEGVSVDLVFIDGDGQQVEPVQFEELRLAVVVDGLGEFEDLQVAIDATVDNGVSTGSYDQQTRFDQDDVDDDGRLTDTVASVRFGEPGSFPTTATGSVLVDGERLPFEFDVVVEIEAVDVVVETLTLGDGLVTIELPSSWEITTDRGVGTTVFSGAEVPPFEVEQLEEVVAAGRVDQYDFAVFRSTRPLTTSVAEVADVLEQAISESGTFERSEGMIDGRASIRLTFSGDVTGTGDVLALGDEIVYVQARAVDGGPEAERIRDSLTFDPASLPALSHGRSIVFDAPVTDPAGATTFTLTVDSVVPGDWVVLEDLQAAVGDPVDGSIITFTVTPSAETVSADEVLDTALLDWSGEPTDRTAVELNGTTYTRVDIAPDSDGPVVIVAAVVPVGDAQVGVSVAAQVRRDDGRAVAVLDEIIASLELEMVSEG